MKITTDIKDCTLDELFDLIQCDKVFIDAMINNICDFKEGCCPMTHKACNEKCSLNYRLRSRSMMYRKLKEPAVLPEKKNNLIR